MNSQSIASTDPHVAVTDGTDYKGPVVVTTLDIAGRPVRLVRPADPDQLLDDPSVQAWNRSDDYMPYWAYLWPGAILLAEAVAREPWETLRREGGPLRALEIGCGLGLGGLAALARGLRVCFSDYDPAPLRFVEQSARENGFDTALLSTRLLDWRDLPDESYPVILAADVLYERRLVPLVADVLARMLAPDGLALIATPYRVSAQGFPAAVAALGLDCRAESVAGKTEDGENQRGTIYRVRRSP